MNAYALHLPQDHGAAWRWSTSAVVMAAAHAALLALALVWFTRAPPEGMNIPAIMVDMTPEVAAAPAQPQPLDIAPAPEMQQTDTPPPQTQADTPPPIQQADAPPIVPPPEPQAQPPAEEMIAPTPPQEKPVVVAPPEPAPAPPKPEPARIEPERAKPPPPKKPAPVRTETKKPAREATERPAPRPSAASAERVGRTAAQPNAGAASAAALPGYRQMLAAHIQRFKQYPDSARAAGQHGTAMLTFTVGRNGQLLGSRLARSSGVPALDAETMAMIRRAQPLPAFPPSMQQASLSFTVPVSFAIR